MSELKKVKIYTDGACDPNPGRGGWAAILRFGEHERVIVGRAPVATNNQMEMRAAIAGLSALKYACEVQIFTDSQYLRRGITDWIPKWKRNGWQTVERTPVKNRELWLELDRLCSIHKVHWQWLRGHSGHKQNERCDELARAQVRSERARKKQWPQKSQIVPKQGPSKRSFENEFRKLKEALEHPTPQLFDAPANKTSEFQLPPPIAKKVEYVFCEICGCRLRATRRKPHLRKAHSGMLPKITVSDI